MSAFSLEKFMSLGIEIHVAANTAQFTKNISKVGKQASLKKSYYALPRLPL
ncbi:MULTISPECIES: hypothetical protein [unclassified Moraxella]|uniref:hypothetical protein n=1 Tax=unclassified Moraxella TaxID=2685852 RepID=UPI002B400B9E|nr:MULTISPECIES: hypothetical protein [unclassified Moraxella]